MRSCVLIAAVLAAASPVLAQEGEPAQEIDPQTQEAIEHFKKGVGFFEKGKFEAALVEFLKSHELRPNWALRYNIGVCYEETGQPVDALEQFRLYLEEGGDTIPEQRRAEVQEHIADLEQGMGFMVVKVNETDAQVIVDDFRKFTSPMDDPIPVEAGFHRLEVRKQGFHTYRAKVTVTSGEEVVHEVELEPVEAPGEEDVELFSWDELMPPEVPTEEKHKPLTGIWIGLGAGGALAVAAAVTGGLVLSHKKKMKDAASACEVTLTRDDCPKAYDHQDKAKKLQVATNVLWGVAGAAAITGLIVFLASKPQAEKKEPAPSKAKPEVAVVPVVVPGQGGAMVGLEATLKF